MIPGALKFKPGSKCLAIERAPLCRIFEKPLENKDMEAGKSPYFENSLKTNCQRYA